LKFRLVETRLKFRLPAHSKRLAVKFLRDNSKINISEKIRMKILAARKICSGALAPVLPAENVCRRSIDVLLLHRLKLRNAGLGSSASASHDIFYR